MEEGGSGVSWTRVYWHHFDPNIFFQQQQSHHGGWRWTAYEVGRGGRDHGLTGELEGRNNKEW